MSGASSEQAKAEMTGAAVCADPAGVVCPDRGPLGLYVHVPFCASTCDFCAFYQQVPTAGDIERFHSGIAREAELVPWDRAVSTVFWGGGTPGLLPPRDLERLAGIMRAHCISAPVEWTIELAPGSVTTDRLAILRDAGITRVSLGVQSFQPALLDALGRQHSREQIDRAYERVRSAGFASVNMDLMFALPGQTAAEWAADIRTAVSRAPDHISTYCLTFEEDTKLWVKLSQTPGTSNTRFLISLVPVMHVSTI
jgi:oxygen-independent coproporphyrinogen III oxidase